MSEYQYYDFLALDRALSAREQRQLREVSSRATITATRFTNWYDYGDLKADPTRLLARYFDAHLYLANWGTHVLAFRFPSRVLSLEVARRYCRGHAARTLKSRDHVVVEFVSNEEADEWIEDGQGAEHVAELLPLRTEIATGDHRALYLAWLLCVQAGELPRSAREPPCPPGLRTLSPALEAMVEFLRVDAYLLEAARAASDDLRPSRSTDLALWVGSLSPAVLRRLAIRFLDGSDPGLRFEALRRFRSSRNAAVPARPRRTVGEILDVAERLGSRRV